MFKKISALLVFVFLFSAVVDATAITKCGTITSGSYTVSNDLNQSYNAICLTLNESNTSIDCRGYKIFVNYTLTTQQKYAIYALRGTSYLGNISISNCVITNSTTGIYFSRVENSTINNVTFYNVTSNTGSNGVSQGSPGQPGTTIYGLYLLTSSNVNASNVTCVNNTSGGGGKGQLGADDGKGGSAGVGGSNYCFYQLTNSKNNNLINVVCNNITAGRSGFAGDGGAIISGGGSGGNAAAGGIAACFYSSDAGSSRLNVTNARATNVKAGSAGNAGYGSYYMCSWDPPYLCDCAVDYPGNPANGGAAYGYRSNSANDSVYNITVVNITSGSGSNGGESDITGGDGVAGSGGVAYGIYGNGANFSMENYTIFNITTGAGGNGSVMCGGSVAGDSGAGYLIYHGVSASSYSRNFMASTVNIGAAGIAETNGMPGVAYGVWLGVGDKNVNWTNGSISGVANYSVYLAGGGDVNHTFLNVSLDKSLIGYSGACIANPCNLTMQWYARVNATDFSNGNEVIVSIDLTDALGHGEYDGVTATSGLSGLIVLNDTTFAFPLANKIYYNNYTVNGSYSTYQPNSTAFNFSYADALVNISFIPLSTCGTIAANKRLYNNVVAAGTCFVFGAGNLWLDCGGYSIQGGNTGAGVNASGLVNVTVENCLIMNFTDGINFTSTNSSLVMNVTSTNNTHEGLFITNSSSDSILNTSSVHNTFYGLYLLTSRADLVANSSFANNGYANVIGVTHSDNNNFTNVSLVTTAYGFYFYTSGNNTVANSTLSNPTGFSDVFSMASARDNVLLNTSFNPSYITWGAGCSPCNLTVRWYERVNVTNDTGVPLVSVINLTDSLLRPVYYGVASLSDFFVVNDSVLASPLSASVYYNNYTLSVIKSGYAENTTIINFTGSWTNNITLYLPVVSVPVVGMLANGYISVPAYIYIDLLVLKGVILPKVVREWIS